MQHEFDGTLKTIESLLGDRGKQRDIGDWERSVADVLAFALKREGLTSTYHSGPRDEGIDLVIQPSNGSSGKAFGAAFKRYATKITAAHVRELLGAAVIHGYDRMILVTDSGFSDAALALARPGLPVSLELLTLKDLRSWIERIRTDFGRGHADAIAVIKECAKQLARVIAWNPTQLDLIEWRDFERVIAAAFEGIGFRTELTPPAKDGGRDVILECTAFGRDRSYIVEAKHWRTNAVGPVLVTDFIEIVARENRDGGLFLATGGYSSGVLAVRTEIARERVRLGNTEKAVAICRTFVKAESGIWLPADSLPDLLFSDTL